MATFYAQVGGKTYGPLDGDKLKRLAAAGKISREDKISKDGKSGWVAAGSVKGLFPAGEPIPSPTTPSAPNTPGRQITAPPARPGSHLQPSSKPGTGGPLPSNRQWRRIAMILVAVGVLGGSAAGYAILQPKWAEQARQRAFADAIETAEKAGLETPDRESLKEARRLARLPEEKSRVAKLEMAIAAVAPVFRLVHAYNQKDVNLMLSQVDSRLEWAARKGVDVAELIPGSGYIKIISKAIPWLEPILGDSLGAQFKNVKVESNVISEDTANLAAVMDHCLTIPGKGETVSHLKVKFTLQRESEPKGWRIHWLARQ